MQRILLLSLVGSFLLLLPAACSDDVADGSDGGAAGATNDSSTPTDAATTRDATSTGDGSAASCFDRGLRQNGGSKEACLACCAAESPDGASAYDAVVVGCACAAGPCASNCHDWSKCGGDAGAEPDYCTFCMEPALSSGGKCASQLASACGTRTACAAYLACAKKCPP